MKKLILLVAITASTAGMAFAQKTSSVVKDDKTVKKTSSVPQKVHNTFSKHKEHNGVKVKHVKEVKHTSK